MEIVYKDTILELLQRYFFLLEKEKGISCTEDRPWYYIRQHELENAILKSFGLPDKIRYRLLIPEYAEDVSDSEFRVEKLYYRLSVKAEEYLSRRTKTVGQLLLSAKLNKEDPFEVLPELRVNANSYTLFIYNEILVKLLDSEEHVMEEFKRMRMLNCLSDIYLLCFEKDYKRNPLYSELKRSGLRYLSHYLKWYHSKKPYIRT